MLAVLGPHQDRGRSCAYDRSKDPARDHPRYTSGRQTDPRVGGEEAGLAVPPKGMGEAHLGQGLSIEQVEVEARDVWHQQSTALGIYRTQGPRRHACS